MNVPEQKAHLAVGFRATTIYDPDRYPLDVLNDIMAVRAEGCSASLETWSLLLTW